MKVSDTAMHYIIVWHTICKFSELLAMLQNILDKNWWRLLTSLQNWTVKQLFFFSHMDLWKKSPFYLSICLEQQSELKKRKLVIQKCCVSRASKVWKARRTLDLNFELLKKKCPKLKIWTRWFLILSHYALVKVRSSGGVSILSKLSH